MGVYQIVAPINEGILSWARECGVSVDGVKGNGRAATLDELMEVVRAIPGYTVNQSRREGDFGILVESEKKVTFPYKFPCKNSVAPGLAEAPATHTHIEGRFDPMGTITLLSFHGHVKLLVNIVNGLTRTCGPQAFFNNFDGIPWLVLLPGATPIGREPWNDEWLESWCVGSE